LCGWKFEDKRALSFLRMHLKTIAARLCGNDIAYLYGDSFRCTYKNEALVGQYDRADGCSIEMIFRHIRSLTDIYPFCHAKAHAYTFSMRPQLV